MIHSLVMLCSFAAGIDSSIQLDREKREKSLLVTLQDEAIWNDKSRKKELLGCLEKVRSLRAYSCIPALIKHLKYSPIPREESFRLMTAEMAFPVYDVLPALGLPAVQPILDHLRLTDPRAAGEDGHRILLLTCCLLKIYDQAGCGKELAKERIRLEIQKVGDKQAGFLTQALENRWLNE